MANHWLPDPKTHRWNECRACRDCYREVWTDSDAGFCQYVCPECVAKADAYQAKLAGRTTATDWDPPPLCSTCGQYDHDGDCEVESLDGPIGVSRRIRKR